MNKYLEEDIASVIARCSNFCSSFSGKTILITGATGLIGSLLVRTLLGMVDDVSIIILTRDEERARKIFRDSRVTILENDETIKERVNYIIHLAAPTQSRFFVEKPVETMDAIISLTRKMLELARDKKVEKFLYVSSMEAYGTILEKTVVDENELGYIALDSTRSSYSEGKRAAELYTFCFKEEYNLPAVVARLAMCFGPGIQGNDRRVHKIFCEEALEGRDILIKSSGETEVNFVYVADAAVALLMLLANGENGETYNISSTNTSKTILDMAKMIAEIGNVGFRKITPEEGVGFAPDNKMVLSSKKMQELGWKPKYDLETSLKRLYGYLEQERKSNIDG